MITEKIGPFHLFPPTPGSTKDAWSMSCEDWGFLPLHLADRDACLVLAGWWLARKDMESLKGLWLKYNRADPPVAVTAEHIMNHFAGEPS